MELEQLSVLDLPPVNPLGLLSLFGISSKDAEAIAPTVCDRLKQIIKQKSKEIYASFTYSSLWNFV